VVAAARREQLTLDRPFADTKTAEPVERSTVVDHPSRTTPDATQDTGVGPAPADTVALWVKAVASMGPTSSSRSSSAHSVSGTTPASEISARDRPSATGTVW